jgi:hypothetical protein
MRTGRPLLALACSSMILAAMLAFTPALAQFSYDRPYRGAIPLRVLLCNFSDAGMPRRTPEQYENFIVGSGMNSLADYWRETSFGSIVLDGSLVLGWYRMGINTRQGVANSRNDRNANFEGCVNRASRSQRPDGQFIDVVITNHNRIVHPAETVDGFGSPGKVFQGENTNITALAHEVGHAMRLAHSFSDRRDRPDWIPDWQLRAEYDDPWDLMSAMNVKAIATHPFSPAGPGLSAYYRDRMGWLEHDKILRFGANGETDQVVDLASLGRPDAAGYHLVRIPFTTTDPNQYLTVEYRTAEGWDAGFERDRVLIHVVTYRDFTSQKEDGPVGYFSFLLRETTGDRDPAQSVNNNGVRIDVVSTDPANGRARVRIRTERPQLCIEPFVWRAARPDDRVCVTGERREQVRRENANYYQFAAPGPRTQGNIRCRDGYVWREATQHDQVCVTPGNRARVREDNRAAKSRTLGFNAYGPNTCKRGFVWRMADKRDWVCVTRQRHGQVAQENRNAAARREPGGGAYGRDTCRQGFVWRSAFPGDRVCVSRESHNKAAKENREANSRLANKEA